jgi:hypothetical protein
MKQLICTCGEKSKPTKSLNCADKMKESGFLYVVSQEGGVLWYCPSCLEKMRNLAKQILSIAKNEYIHLPSLLNEHK